MKQVVTVRSFFCLVNKYRNQDKLKFLFLSIILCRSVALNAQSSRLYLNHIYFVLDSASYHNLLKSSFFTENYGNVDEGLPNFKVPGEHATIIYLRGQTTYIEIMRSSNKFDVSDGSIGLGFSWDNNENEIHDSTFFEKRLSASANVHAYKYATSQLTINGQRTRWYRSYYRPDSLTNLYSWYGVYDPAFLTTLTGSYHHQYTRQALLDLARVKKRLYKDLSAIHLSCTPADFERLRGEMMDMGFSEQGRGKHLSFNINGITLYINKAPHGSKRSMLQYLIIKLAKMNNRHLTFNNLVIKNKGTKSIWKLK